jgi:hypothetical protein
VHPVVVSTPPEPPPLPPPPEREPPPARTPPRGRKVAAVEKPVAPLDQKTLDGVVKAAHPRLTECLRRFSADLPAASGQIIIEVTVASSGRVSAARALMPEIHSAGLGSCLATEATRLRFPRHADKQISFRFPLVYQRKS